MGEAKVGDTRVEGVRISADGRALFALDGDGLLVELTLPELRPQRRTDTTLGHVGPMSIGRSHPSGLDISYDGRTALVANSGGQFSFWRTDAGALQQRVDRAITVDGREVPLATCQDEPLSFYHLAGREAGLVRFEFMSSKRTFHALPYSAPCLSPKGDRVFLRGHDDRVRIWRRGAAAPEFTGLDQRDNFYREVLVARPETDRWGVADPYSYVLVTNGGGCFVTSDFRFAVTTSLDHAVHLWDLRGRTRMRSYTVGQRIWSVGGGASSLFLAASCSDGLRFWHHGGEAPRAAIAMGASHELAVGCHGALAASGGKEGRVLLWDIENGRLLGTLEGQVETITAIAISVDQQLVVTGSEGGRVRVWALEWELFAPAAQWDERADALIAYFVSAHPPTWKKPWFRPAFPSYRSEQEERLKELLGRAGYGWLDPEKLQAALVRAAGAP
jgi:WD40 repeat protein